MVEDRKVCEDKDVCGLWKSECLELIGMYSDGMTETSVGLARFEESSAVGFEQ